MTEDLADRTREGIEAFSRGDQEDTLEGFSPDIVWEVTFLPETSVYRGHDGVRRFWAEWRELFEGFRLEVVECEAVDDKRVLATTRALGTGAGSGASVASPEFVQLFEYEGGKAVRVRLATTRARALDDRPVA